ASAARPVSSRSLPGTNRAQASWPRPMVGIPARPACAWRHWDRARPTWSRRGICTAWRHADSDGYRTKADQKVEAGPLPDTRRGRRDDAVDQVHPSARQRRQHPSRVREAFRLAEEEKPGATHVELPEDVATENT